MTASEHSDADDRRGEAECYELEGVLRRRDQEERSPCRGPLLLGAALPGQPVGNKQKGAEERITAESDAKKDAQGDLRRR